jgi:two-component system sensor histidine kinase YesM
MIAAKMVKFMISTLYNKYIKRKLFNKIFITFSTATVTSFLLFAYMTSVNIGAYYRNKLSESNEQVLADTAGYLEQKINAATDIIQSLYTNPLLYSEILYLMENGYNKHLEYKLDKLFSSRENRYNGFENHFHSCLTRDSGLIGICIYSDKQDKAFIYSSKSRIVYPKDGYISKHLKESIRDSYSLRVIPAHSTHYPGNTTGQDMAFSVVYGVKEKFSSKTTGFIIIDYAVDTMKNYLVKSGTHSRARKDYPGNVIALTPKGEVIFDLSGRKYGKPYPEFEALKKSRKGTGIYRDNVIHITTSASTGLLIATILPQKAIRQSASSSEKTVFLIALSCIIAILIFTRFAVRTFSKRTGSVTEGIKKIRQGDLSARIPVKKNGDELSEIALSFNAMCEDLNSHIRRVYLAEISRKNAQIKALQTQINPHFLYNTLESIRMRALASGARDAGDMIYLLAALFRNSIKEDIVVSIHEEIKYAKMYLELNNRRLGDKISVEFDAGEETLDLGIIKHTIQPVIENYIIHGMNAARKDNRLMITISKSNEDIQIRVSDNGNGIPKEKLDIIVQSLETTGGENVLARGSNIGLVNVNERIKLLFSREYGLAIQSREGAGTTVFIKMPAMSREEMERYVQGTDCG